MRTTLCFLGFLLAPTVASAQTNTQLWGNVIVDWLKESGTTTSEPFTTSDNIVNLRLKRVFWTAKNRAPEEPEGSKALSKEISKELFYSSRPGRCRKCVTAPSTERRYNR